MAWPMRAGVALEVSLPRLYHGYTSAIMTELADGRLGELTYCRIRLSHDGAIAGWLPDRFYDPDGCGGRRPQRPRMPSGLPHPALPRCTPSHAERDVRLVHPPPGRGPSRCDARILGRRDRCHRTGFLSRDPFIIEMHGTKASLVYEGTQNLLQIQRAGADTWQSLPIPQDDANPFKRWVSHIREATRADDNLSRAVELTRLVSAANTAAATQTTVRYPIGAA